MRIVCPSCSAAYDVPDSLVTPGRVVRCARCAGEWAPVDAAAAVAEPEPPAPPSPTLLAAGEPPPAWSAARESAMDRLAANPAVAPSKLLLRTAWAASIVLLLLGIAGAYAWRQEIMAAWPPSERAYALFGMNQPETRQ
jgi:predicted Zn finger-like uncharacterized protein